MPKLSTVSAIVTNTSELLLLNKEAESTGTKSTLLIVNWWFEPEGNSGLINIEEEAYDEAEGIVFKDPVNQLVVTVELSLCTQLTPFELVGKLAHLPVPSFHDWDTVCVNMFSTSTKFPASIEVNSKLTFVLSSAKVECPIISRITSFICSLLNFNKILEGYNTLFVVPLSLTNSKISSLPVLRVFYQVENI